MFWMIVSVLLLAVSCSDSSVCGGRYTFVECPSPLGPVEWACVKTASDGQYVCEDGSLDGPSR